MQPGTGRGTMASMKKVKVALGSRSYDIRIGAGLLGRIGPWLKEKGFAGKAVVITDSVVKGLHAAALEQGLASAGFTVTVLEVPAGEEQKTLETAGRLYDKLAAAYAERTTPVVALGGGVIGDLAGFVAATYLRGVPLVQVPTTLLAMVDSSIGGKTAVDHSHLKNVIGGFYQPVMVAADIDTLPTLPEIELTNGLAEVIKSAAIRDREFFNFLDLNMKKAREVHPGVMEDIVMQAARIKAEIVAQDETEAGPRVLLNFGHTIGHAVEAVSGFRLKHGQAVAIGMVGAARISNRMGVLAAGESFRLEEVIRKAGLPTEVPDIDKEAVLRAMRHDKKVLRGQVRFILLRSIGDAFISDEVAPALVREVLVGRA